MRVDALSKPAFVPCPHAAAGGCTIYSRRPAVCEEFRCQWLQGRMLETDRPDLLGVIVSLHHHPRYGLLPLLVECARGSAERPRVAALIEHLARTMPVMLLTPAGERVYGPRPEG